MVRTPGSVRTERKKNKRLRHRTDKYIMLVLPLLYVVFGVMTTTAQPAQISGRKEAAMKDTVIHSDAEWRDKLTHEQFRILRKKGTEPAFTGKYYQTDTPGVYVCAACGQELFSSEAKYHSGSGWPSFWQPIDSDAVDTAADNSLLMRRTEVHCSRCGGHLGHVFDDGPQPTGLRYCVNSAALKLDTLEEKNVDEADGE